MTREKKSEIFGEKNFWKGLFSGKGVPPGKILKFLGKKFFDKGLVKRFGFLRKIYREQLWGPFLGCTPSVGREGVYPLRDTPRNTPVKASEMPHNRLEYAG